jgi:hypothetical protein
MARGVSKGKTKQTDEERKAKAREYNSRPEVKAKKKAYGDRPEVKAKKKAYGDRPEVRARLKARQRTPEYKAMRKVYEKTPEQVAKRKARQSNPELIAKRRARQRTPEYRAKHKISDKKYLSIPENRAKRKARTQTPEHKAKNKIWANNYRQKPEVKSKRREDYKNLRDLVYSHYSKIISKSEFPCCNCCGEFEMEFLTLDHIAGKKQMDSEPELVKLGYSSKFNGDGLWLWIKRNNFPEGFQVLCQNCNFAKGKRGNNNTCPHEKMEFINQNV